MMKWLRSVSFCCFLVGVAGCGGSRELPPKTDSQPTLTPAESAEKAVKGIPPEIRAKMKGTKTR